MNSLKAEIQAQIDVEQAKFDSIEMSLEESQANADKVFAIATAEPFDAAALLVCGSTLKADLYQEIQRLKKTLSQNLVQIKTRFVLTTQDKLECPSGFHPSERVFVLEEGHTMVGVEKLPRSSMRVRGLDMIAFEV